MSPACVTSAQRQVSNGTPAIEYVQVPTPNAGHALKVDRDIRVQFLRAYRFFFIASMGNLRSSGLYVHFNPLGLPADNPAGNTIAPSGGEAWLPLWNANNPGNSTAEGRWFRTNYPIDHFYIDIDHGVGIVAGGICIGGTNDLELGEFNRKG